MTDRAVLCSWLILTLSAKLILTWFAGSVMSGNIPSPMRRRRALVRPEGKSTLCSAWHSLCGFCDRDLGVCMNLIWFSFVWHCLCAGRLRRD